jgi:UDP-N-acetylglucosamine 3-dehydrogenase
MLKVGVIGTGNMGKNHLRVFSEIKDVNLVGFSDTNSETRRVLENKFSVQSYGNYEDLLSKVDAVSIAVPTKFHKEVASNAILNGVHCLVEKPISSSIEDAEYMVSLAEKNNILLAVGHIENFNPAVRETKKIVDLGSLGKILIISSRRVGPFAKRIEDVGIDLDLASHEIAAIRYILGIKDGGFSSVFLRLKGLRNKKGDYAVITSEVSDIILNIEVNWFTPYKLREMLITGSEAVLSLNYEDQTVKINSKDCVKILNITKEEPLKLEICDFIECVKTGKIPVVTGFEGLQIVKLILESKKY